MNKTRFYSKRFMLFMFTVLALYLGLFYTGIFHFKVQNAWIIALSNMGLFLLGTLIIAPGLNKDHETFLLRFLLLTTLQLLTVFGTIAALAFMKINGARALGFHFAGLFFVLYVIETVLVEKMECRGKW